MVEGGVVVEGDFFTFFQGILRGSGGIQFLDLVERDFMINRHLVHHLIVGSVTQVLYLLVEFRPHVVHSLVIVVGQQAHGVLVLLNFHGHFVLLRYIRRRSIGQIHHLLELVEFLLA